MGRIILNQIALQKIKVISETKKYFLLQPSSAAAPSTSNYGITPPTYTQTGYSGWSDTEPSYTVGDERVLYELTETIYSDRTWDYSTPTISSSYEAAKEAYNEVIEAEQTIAEFEELGLKQGYIWDNETYVPASSTIPVYPIGTYIASGILVNGGRTITRKNSNTYGLNTWISTGGINLRYNAIDLMKLTTSNLLFYYPSTSTQQKKAISLGTNGAVNSLAFYGFNNDNKTMELTNGALTFYDPSNGTSELAVLNTNGLVLKKGGITSGSSGQSGFVFLSSEPYGSYSINGSTGISDWKEIIGTNFGIRADGTLYASNANITGAIVATSLDLTTNNVKIGTGSINGLKSVATSGSYNDLTDKPTIPSLTGYIYVNGTIGNTPADGATGFVVETGGLLKASNAIVYGNIYASAGYIGGWQIGTDGNKTLHNGNANTSPTIGNGTIILSKGLTSSTSIAGSSGNQTWAFASGTNFGVTTSGTLYATGARISGAITATSLTIDGTNYANDVKTISNKANSADSNWSVSITTSGTPDYITPSVTLVATIYHNGAIATSGFSTPQWYKNGSTTALSGATYANGKSTITVTDVDAYYTCTISSN